MTTKSFNLFLIMVLLGLSIVRSAGKEQKIVVETAPWNKDNKKKYPWIKKGKLLKYDFNVLADQKSQDDIVEGTSHPYNFFVYIYPSEESMVLSGNLEALNECLKAELLKLPQEEVKTFLREYCAVFLKDIMANGDCSNLVSKNTYIYPRGTRVKEPENFISAPDLKIEENSWRLTFNLDTELGAIETWIVTGTLNPILVQTLVRKQRFPFGTIRRAPSYK